MPTDPYESIYTNSCKQLKLYRSEASDNCNDIESNIKKELTERHEVVLSDLRRKY